MSAQQSNLSGSQWMYDMVVGVTQNSVNQTLFKFLKKFAGANIEYYEVINPEYSKRNPTVPRTLVSDAEAIRKIVGKDIFSVEVDSEVGDAIAEGKQFSLAIRGKLGVPDYADKILDIVQFDQGHGTKVSFRMCYKELEIVYVEYDQDGASLRKFVQNKDNFFTFTFVVDLNLKEENEGFNTLTPEQQALIKNLNPDTMFSVNQLYLDLTAPKLQSSPDIKGIDKDSYEGQVIITKLQERYWNTVHNSSAKGVILGTTVLPKKYNPKLQNPSLIPTNLNFMVMPYMNADGKSVKENQGYATLNYLIASENRKLNPPSQFGWNWVQPGHQAHGVMAIRKENILSFLKAAFEKSTQPLLYEPTAEIKSGGLFDLKDYIHVTYTNVNYTPQFQTTTDGLEFSFYREAQAKSSTRQIDPHSQFNVKISISGNKIKMDLTMRYYIDYFALGLASMNTRFFPISEKSTVYTFEMTVNAAGKLNVTLKDIENKPIFVVKPAEVPDPQKTFYEAAFETTWGIDLVPYFFALMEKFKGLGAHLEYEYSQIAQNLENLLNNSNAWVFPGGNTFAFKEVGFSDNLDLVSHITYVNPS